MRALPMAQLYPLLAEQMEGGGSCLLAVTGSSMLPTLRQGRDVVVLRRPEELRRGDVILYRRESGQYVLHRIIRHAWRDCLCCGDNQRQTERVKREQILAVVSAVRRGGRLLSTRSFGWRLWSRLWLALFPARRPILWARRRLGRLRQIRKNGRR